jgi:hypothetical protein
MGDIEKVAVFFNSKKSNLKAEKWFSKKDID